MKDELPWIVLYNAAVLAAICVLCWIFGNGWPLLLIFIMSDGKSEKK